MEIVLNKSTEVEEEEYAGGNKFPGSENCILSQALTLRDYRGLWTVVFLQCDLYLSNNIIILKFSVVKMYIWSN